MAGTRDPSNRPVAISVVVAVAIFLATSFISITNVLSRFLSEMVLAVQIFAGVTYFLIIVKYAVDSGLIYDYNPQMSLAKAITDIFGPVFGLAAELVTVVTYAQLSNLLFSGITFRNWKHQLPANGPNYWLLTLLAVFFLIIAVLNLLSRINDARYYWSDLSEIEP